MVCSITAIVLEEFKKFKHYDILHSYVRTCVMSYASDSCSKDGLVSIQDFTHSDDMHLSHLSGVVASVGTR